MCEKPFICLLLIWYVLGPLKTFISAFVRACVRAEMRVSERREGAIHVLLIYTIFVAAFILFFFFFTLRSVFVYWIRYKNDVISSNAYRSVARMTQVFDLEICSISKTLLQE